MRSFISVMVAATALAPGPVAAENCAGSDVAPREGGHPCGGVGTSLGRVEVWRGPGFVDVRVSLLRLMLYDPGGGAGFELGSWEAIGDGGGDGLEAPRDFGDRSALHVLTWRQQHDADGWGAYVAGDLVTRWFGHLRLATPRLGLRLGRFDRAALVVEAQLAGAFALGDYDRWSVTDDVDVSARLTQVVVRRLRLEARGRYRDLTAADGRRLRDVTGAIGVELEASPGRPPSTPTSWRVMTVFVGVAARRALIDVDPADALSGAALMRAGTPSAPSGAALMRAGTPSAPVARAPWQVMAWVDLDFVINSARTIW
ncbi:MAG: hypothetical protein IPL61_31270 [Myxococcales bacterium]|nr:hypothetical protein [Myxococcales bacterium]